MDANTVTAICAAVIALAALVISFLEARAARHHDRLSVQPLLQLSINLKGDGGAGIVLTNHGLGPAIIAKTALTLDGECIGAWNRENVLDLCKLLPSDFRYYSFGHRTVVPVGFEKHLLKLDKFAYEKHSEFLDLIQKRIRLEIHYESLYGGEEHKTVFQEYS